MAQAPLALVVDESVEWQVVMRDDCVNTVVTASFALHAGCRLAVAEAVELALAADRAGSAALPGYHDRDHAESVAANLQVLGLHATIAPAEVARPPRPPTSGPADLLPGPVALLSPAVAGDRVDVPSGHGVAGRVHIQIRGGECLNLMPHAVQSFVAGCRSILTALNAAAESDGRVEWLFPPAYPDEKQSRAFRARKGAGMRAAVRTAVDGLVSDLERPSVELDREGLYRWLVALVALRRLDEQRTATSAVDHALLVRGLLDWLVAGLSPELAEVRRAALESPAASRWRKIAGWLGLLVVLCAAAAVIGLLGAANSDKPMPGPSTDQQRIARAPASASLLPDDR